MYSFIIFFLMLMLFEINLIFSIGYEMINDRVYFLMFVVGEDV